MMCLMCLWCALCVFDMPCVSMMYLMHLWCIHYVSMMCLVCLWCVFYVPYVSKMCLMCLLCVYNAPRVSYDVSMMCLWCALCIYDVAIMCLWCALSDSDASIYNYPAPVTRSLFNIGDGCCVIFSLSLKTSNQHYRGSKQGLSVSENDNRETSMRTNDKKKMFWCLHNSRKLSADTPHRMFHKIVRHGIPIKQTKNKTRNKNWTINFFKLHNTLSLRHLDCKEFSLVDGNFFFFLVLDYFKTTLTTASFFLRNLWFGVLQNKYHDGGY